MTSESISENEFHKQYESFSIYQHHNLPMASQFLSTIAEGELITFQTFDESVQNRGYLTKILHGTFEEHKNELMHLNKQGAGIFFTVNQTDGKGRQSNNVTKVRAVFVDLDGAPLAPVLEAPISPHIIVESSKNRYHAYWLIEGLPKEQFKIVQEHLIKRFDGDKQVKDLSRVMRLPGFFHQKKEPILTNVLENARSLPISVEKFISAFGVSLEGNSEKTPFVSSETNPILAALTKAKMLICKDNSTDGYRIKCPWGHLHTTKGDDAQYFEPYTKGYAGHGFKCFHSHCEARKGEDLLNFLGQSLKGTKEEWGTPVALSEGLPPVKSLEPDMLPEVLREWIWDIADRMQIPPDFCSAEAIVVLSSLIGRRLGIFPKQKDDWVVVPNLWGAIVGRPSLLKSPAIAEIMKPLDRLETDALKRHKESMKQYEEEELQAKVLKDALQNKLKAEARKVSPNFKNILDQQHNIETPDEPHPERYKTEDCTVEKVGEILSKNQNGLLIHRDELTGFLKSLDKDGRESDRAFYLESWNGTGSFTVDRIKRGTVHIPAICLSIIGGIQPGPLSSYIYQAVRGGSGDDGLIQRFQVIVWPDVPKEWKRVDRSPNSNAKKRAYEIFDKIDKYIHPLTSEDLNSEIPAVHFSSEAQDLFNDWWEKHENRIRNKDLSSSMESHLSKYRKLLPSLSLIFQLCDDLDRGFEIKHVGQEAVELAIRWCAYLETHAQRLYASVENEGNESARALLDHLHRGDVSDGFAIRDIYHKHWSKLSTQEEVQRAVDILTLHGWLQSHDVKTPGRTKQIFKIHPQILERKNQNSSTSGELQKHQKEL